MRRAIVAVGVVISLLVGGVAVGEKPVREPSKISLSNKSAGTYTGKVKSDARKCRKKREVAVFHDQNANGLDSQDFEIGRTKTNKKGKYKVNGNQAPAGDAVIAQTGSVRRGKLICKPAKISIPAGT